MNLQHIGSTGAVQDRGHTCIDIRFTILTFQQSGYGDNTVLVIQNSLDDTGTGCGNTVVGSSLSIVDLPALSGSLLHQLVQIHISHQFFVVGDHIIKRFARNRHGRPGYHLGITMFSHAVTLDASGIHVHQLADQILQTGRINGSTGADDLILWQTGNLLYIVGQNIHRIGDHDKNTVEAALHNGRNNGLTDLGAHFQGIQSGLTGLGRCTGSDHDNVHVATIRVSTRGHLHIPAQIFNGILQIPHFTNGTFPVNIDHHDLIADTLGFQAESGSRSHQAAANNCHSFSGYFHVHFLPFLHTHASFDFFRLISLSSAFSQARAAHSTVCLRRPLAR